MLKGFANDKSGATSIEYGLIALVIATVLVVAMTSIGSSLNAFLEAARAGLGGGA